MNWVTAKYAIERHLGSGGMAEVFVARSVGAEGFTRRVAIKRVLGGLMTHPELGELLIAEARISARLQHPNIVSVLDFDRDADGKFFLVMELVEGVSLDRLIGAGPLSVPLIIYLAVEILTGLRYAHDLPAPGDDGVRGIVHRDISPHNVLLSWEGVAKIADFGIAKVRAASLATASQHVRGKPAYMSPEQALARPLDGRSDLFAVGVMLWQMLCGRHLFHGADLQEVLAQLLVAPIPSPREVRPDVPADLARAVEKLLARDPAQRTPNADTAMSELIACADHPRHGREVLIEALEERFPGRAPVHAHRARRAPAGGVLPVAAPTPGAPGPPAHVRVTVTQRPGAVVDPVAPAARSPGRRQDRRRRAWIAVACGAVAAGLVAGGFVRRFGAGRSNADAAGPGASQVFSDGPHATTPRAVVEPTKDSRAAPAPSGGSISPGRSSIDAARNTPDRARAPASTPPPKSRPGGVTPQGAGSGSNRMREVRFGE